MVVVRNLETEVGESVLENENEMDLWKKEREKWRLVHALLYRLYYCKVGMPIRLGLTELKTNDDVQEFMRLRYISKWVIDLYTEHFDYDVLDFIDASQIENVSETMMSITLVMNKKNLISNRGKFRGYIDEPIENGMDDTIKDPLASHIDPEHKVKSGVLIGMLCGMKGMTGNVY
ncbi:hypothetical protein Tco_0706717 [Tanacetum coccineum]|uniref:DNA-directed RNA polymerase n=1 Tax=Tanacetum coccineum TaxID=301880 RepID=A0ABQ4Y9R1_9ASTR